MSRHRLAVIVLVVALVVGGVALDRSTSDDVVASGGPTVDASAFPVAGDPSDLGSTWFCAGGTADEEAFADHVVAILNPTDAPMRVTVTAFAGEVAPPVVNANVDGEETTTTTTTSTTVADLPREPVVRPFDIAARSRRRIAMSDLVSAPIVSALIEADAGGLVVEHEVSSIHGFDAKPCVTGASDQWHFAWGTTERDARELLVLFNPFPADAIVDGRFSTEDGVREPVRWNGFVVPGRSTVAVDLGDDVTRRAEVAASITARTGRLVVDRIVRVNQDGGPRGLTVEPGVSRPQQAWVFPDGFLSDEVAERYAVYNPTERVAEVEVDFVLDRPEQNGVPEPMALTLAPGEQTVVDVGADGRVPAGLGHAAVVRSSNDVPVVAERILTSSLQNRRGITVMTGSPVVSREWSFASGAVNDDWDEVLLVLNLDPQVLADVDVYAVSKGQAIPLSELQGIEVEANGRLAIKLGTHVRRDDLAILVRSTEPVVVERGLHRVGADARGASTAIGVPGNDGLGLPPGPVVEDLGADLGDVPTSAVDDVPTAPDDVQLPESDQTIVIDDPDADAGDPGATSTSTSP